MRWTAHVSEQIVEALDAATEGTDKVRGDLLEDLVDLGYVDAVRDLWLNQKAHADRLKEQVKRNS